MLEADASTRRLVAILASDVAGYSRLMQADEAAALKGLGTVRAIIEAQIARHRGRLANTAGDSVLAEFASAVDALSCALIIQELMIHERHRSGDIKVRIGIHMGDVVVRGNDILGTAVNIAARLESLAQPGGVAVSAAVHDDVAGKLPAVFTSLGPRNLKNIDQPVHVYSVLPEAGGSTLAIAAVDQRLKLPESRGISIVVLPFVNMSSDANDAFLSDGLTEDLITELSRIRDFLVIARNTAFTYKGRAVDVTQVGRELGVRYVLEGSMRSLGTRVRITAQVIDVKTGSHLWAEKFDRERSALFDIQDEVVRAVAASTQIQLLIRAGQAGPGETNEDRWARGMQAWAELYRMTADSLAHAEKISQQLTREYPDWPRGHQLLGSAIYHLIIMGFRPARPEVKEEALRQMRQAVKMEPNDEYNLVHLSMALMDFEGSAHEAQVLLRRALEINPSFSLAYGLLGEAYRILGHFDEAIHNTEIAIRLNPRDPSNFYRYECLAIANSEKRDDDKALHWAGQVIALKPDFWSGYAITAAVLAGRNELDRAAASAEALKRCWPDVSIAAIKAAVPGSESPWRKWYFDNLAAAGIPLETKGEKDRSSV